MAPSQEYVDWCLRWPTRYGFRLRVKSPAGWDTMEPWLVFSIHR